MRRPRTGHAETRARYPVAVRILHRVPPLVAALVLVLCAVRPAAAADATFTLTPDLSRVVYDEAGVVTQGTADIIPDIARIATDTAGVAPIVYVHRVPTGGTPDARAAADALAAAWSAADPDAARTAIVMLEVAGDPACPVDVAIRIGPAYETVMSQAEADSVVDAQLRPSLAVGCDPDVILMSAAGSLTLAAAGLSTGPTPRPGAADAPAVGPPFPAPEGGRRVYDFAGAFTADTIAKTEAAIAEIEARTGAQVAVYTQVKPWADASSTEQDAIALVDQWGVGRKGFDDGLVILWNLDESLKHGQVQLYAGPGFRNLISNDQRQSIFENDMVPRLRGGDLDGAMLAAIDRIDELATPENANRLQLFRQLNALLGLVGGPIVFLLTAGWVLFHWRRYGRDPQVTESSSMFMPAPPPGMTAAAGSVVLDGSASRKSLTAALLDLASRGELAFEQEEVGRFVKSTKVGIRIEEPETSDPRVALNRRDAVGPPERWLLDKVDSTAGSDRHIPADKILELGPKIDKFSGMLEKRTVELGWFTGPPSTVKGRWVGLGVAEVVLAGLVLFAAMMLPSDGLTLVAIGLGAGGIVTIVVGAFMPARTMHGAMARVWLDGYRRTLKATMEQARSMDEVVAKSGLTWLETPDRAVVWGTALGLQAEIQGVLERSIEDVTEGRTTAVYLPIWFHSSGSGGGGWGQGGGGLAPGLMAGSAVPDLGGMMSALGTIGSSPSSSGGGGGGGFGGGGSGGGGGGAGGGF